MVKSIKNIRVGTPYEWQDTFALAVDIVGGLDTMDYRSAGDYRLFILIILILKVLHDGAGEKSLQRVEQYLDGMIANLSNKKASDTDFQNLGEGLEDFPVVAVLVRKLQREGVMIRTLTLVEAKNYLTDYRKMGDSGFSGAGVGPTSN